LSFSQLVKILRVGHTALSLQITIGVCKFLLAQRVTRAISAVFKLVPLFMIADNFRPIPSVSVILTVEHGRFLAALRRVLNAKLRFSLPECMVRDYRAINPSIIESDLPLS
jgi:hypothetical protein